MRKNTTEKIADVEKEIEQLEALKKQLLHKQKEETRKARTRRLCDRAGYLESILPDTIGLTLEQFQTFLDKTLLTGYAEKILKGLTPTPTSMQENGADPARESGTPTSTPKPTQTASGAA